jgi:glycerophosphoryl diester phosphodiesterase
VTAANHEGRRALRVAHRGDHRQAPENSIAAMIAALGVRGCDGLEFDLQAAVDGTPVVIHDPTLLRTHGRSERTDALTVSELQELGIPTLSDLLAVVPADRFLDVELKAQVAEATVQALGPRRDAPARVIVSSFERSILEALRVAAPRIPRWLNSESLDRAVVEEALHLGCSTISAEWRTIDEQAVDAVRSAGLELAAWTVREPGEAARLERLGVVAVCVEGAALEA